MKRGPGANGCSEHDPSCVPRESPHAERTSGLEQLRTPPQARERRLRSLALAHPDEVEELLVRLGAPEPIHELEHRLLRRHLHEDATQRLERGELAGCDQLLLLARAALRNVDRGVDAALRELAREEDL